MSSSSSFRGRPSSTSAPAPAPLPSSCVLLTDLWRHLRQERLFVQSEKRRLTELNAEVRNTAERLAHSAYVARKQRENLAGGAQDEGRAEVEGEWAAAATCQRANLLERTEFVDAYKILQYQEVLYCDFFRTLRHRPQLLAACLSHGDARGLVVMPTVVTAVFGGIYGACVMPEDERLVLELLKHLMRRQLKDAPNPRKMIRQGKCSFAKIYKAFSEELFSAKLFLTAALYEPILNLLSEDDLYLDIDPAKATLRFSAQERLKKFGKEGTPEFEKRLREHREFVVLKLHALASRFVDKIQRNLHCFPRSLAYILRAIYTMLTRAERDPREVNAVCVDVVFDLFICPALIDPNPVGIIDTPISYIARSNLMQVAQILQSLALWKWEEIDPRLMDLYSRFDKDCMSSVLESMLEIGEMAEAGHYDVEEASQEETLSRLAILLTRQQCEGIISFLRDIQDGIGDTPESDELAVLVAPLPESFPGATNGSLIKSASLSSSKSDDSEELSTSSGKANAKKFFASKISTVANAGMNAVMKREDTNGQNDEEKASVLIPRDAETVLVLPIPDGNGVSEDDPVGFLSEDHVLARTRQASRVVRMNLAHLEEDEDGDRSGGRAGDAVSVVTSTGNVEKQTRFSLSNHEGSIGNTSDNLEAISEAASDHSVESSLEEDEVDQAEDPIIDNLSDMVSANVSGRGTPNVSGRDTPSSQVTEGDAGGRGEDEEGDRGEEDNEAQQALPNRQEGVNRQNDAPVERQRAPPIGVNGRKNGEPDLEEKFGRFEIKPPPRPSASSHFSSSEQGDEIVSMVSDTWSTDVLASDTEGLIDFGERPSAVDDLQPQRRDMDEFARRNRLLDELVVPAAGGARPEGGSIASASGSNLLDISETASEAWSMDVLASDNESLRLGDLDNEDTASVARSDDTRFTDDTTRSDPEPLFELGSSGVSSHGGSLRGRHPRDDVTRRAVSSAAPMAASTPSAKDGHLKPTSRNAAVEQWARQSSGRPAVGGLPRRGSDSAGLTQDVIKVTRTVTMHETSILKKSTAASLSTSTTSTFTRTNSGPSAHSMLVNTSSTANSSIQGASTASESDLPNSPPHHLSAASIASSSESSTGDIVNRPNRINSNPDMDTGAIPKSISFDKTYEDAEKKGASGRGGDRASFFRSFNKLSKMVKSGSGGGRGGGRGKRTEEFVPIQNSAPEQQSFDETSDDILAKYKKKSHSVPQVSARPSSIDALDEVPDEVDDRLVIDPNNIEESFAFMDAKRKLRKMLSEAEIAPVFNNLQRNKKDENEVVWFLRVQLAEANNLLERGQVAQLHETLRCLSLFDSDGVRKLIKALKEDYKRRSPYLSYLVRCRQGLLSTHSHLQRFLNRIESDRRVNSQHLVSVCMRLFLERRESALQHYLFQFKEANVSDEKIALTDSFLTSLFQQLESDPAWALVATEEQMKTARQTIERSVVSHIYLHALYPNGEADASRDRVFQEHIDRLSRIVTPSHRDLRVPRRYHYESPWPSAQAVLKRLAAYKTPADKVACVARCSQTIMNLLSLATADTATVPAADDFVPVMVFVLIKANPPSLLSTVQYVDNFGGDRMAGEEQYWWMQFVTAIEFVKTMEDS